MIREREDGRAHRIKLIHIAKSQLGMDDSTYRALLHTIGNGATSSTTMDYAQHMQLLDHFKACGWKPRPPKARKASAWDWVNNAAEDRKPMLRKIAVILREADREKAYVDEMAKRMCRVERVEFCRPDQLHDIVAALVADQKRRAAR